MYKVVYLLMFTVFLLAGCGGGGSSSGGSSSKDTDGDGLTDTEEITKLGTNPMQKDTDGDGWSDSEEIGNGSLNPLIANMPRLKFEITKSPTISLNYTETDGSTHSEELSEGSTVSQGTSRNNSNRHTSAMEHGWSAQLKLGYTWGLTGGASVEATLGGHGNYSAEDSYEWGSTKTAENTQNVQEAEAYEESHTTTKENGTMAVTARLINPSDIAYTLKSILVTSYYMDQSAANFYSTINNMEVDNGFQMTTLNTNGFTGEILFSTPLSLDLAKKLAAKTPSIVFALTGYSISMTDDDGNTKDFTANMTLVAARCAKITIDQGVGSYEEPKEYLVATQTRHNENYTSEEDYYEPVSLYEILSHIGLERGTDYTVAANGHIDMLQDLRENDTTNSQWVISIERKDEDVMFLTKSAGYDLDTTIIQAGDSVTIFYSTDKDRDGLVQSIENIYGTSDENNDTDGDTISDFYEVIGWDHDDDNLTSNVYTNPTVDDTDYDGLKDNVDPDPTQRYPYTSTEIYSLKVEDYKEDEVEFSLHNGIYSIDKEVAGQQVKIKVVTATPVKSVTLDNVPMHRSATNPLLFTSTKSLNLGDNYLDIEVTSEDEENVASQRLKIDSVLEDIDFNKIAIYPQGLSSDGKGYQMDIAVNWNEYSDTRAEGALLIFKTETTSDAQLENRSELPKTIKDDGDDVATHFASGEKALKHWDNPKGYPNEKTDLNGDYFKALRINEKYSFRVVMYAKNSQNEYCFSKGSESKSYITPYPSKIKLSRIDTELYYPESSSYHGDIYVTQFIQPGNFRSIDETFRFYSNPRKDWSIDLSNDSLEFEIPSDKTDMAFEVMLNLSSDIAYTINQKVQLIDNPDDDMAYLGAAYAYDVNIHLDNHKICNACTGSVRVRINVSGTTTAVEEN